MERTRAACANCGCSARCLQAPHALLKDVAFLFSPLRLLSVWAYKLFCILAFCLVSLSDPLRILVPFPFHVSRIRTAVQGPVAGIVEYTAAVETPRGRRDVLRTVGRTLAPWVAERMSLGADDCHLLLTMSIPVSVTSLDGFGSHALPPARKRAGGSERGNTARHGFASYPPIN